MRRWYGAASGKRRPRRPELIVRRVSAVTWIRCVGMLASERRAGGCRANSSLLALFGESISANVLSLSCPFPQAFISRMHGRFECSAPS